MDAAASAVWHRTKASRLRQEEQRARRLAAEASTATSREHWESLADDFDIEATVHERAAQPAPEPTRRTARTKGARR